MNAKPTLRLLTVAVLAAVMGAGCARTPNVPQAGLPVTRDAVMGARANPVSAEALVLARKWHPQAAQVGVSIIADQAGDDRATYVFTSSGKRDALLIVAATDAGLKAQEVPVSASAASGLSRMVPMTGLEGKLLDSKVLFRQAGAAGLAQPGALVVLNALDHANGMPAAVVTSLDGQQMIVLDAATGKALSAVSRLGGRHVQMHELALVVTAVGIVGTVVVLAAKKLIAKYWKPKPKPSPSGEPSPSPAPSATPSAGPSPTPAPVLSVPPM